MDYFVQQLINGLTLGSIYGLIAIGYTMVYGIIGMINFAHGDIFMIGGFIALITFLILVSFGLTADPAGPADRAAGRRWRSPRSMAGRSSASPTGRCAHSFRLAPLISAIGMSIVLQNLFADRAGRARQAAAADHHRRLHAASRARRLRRAALQHPDHRRASPRVVLLALFTWLVSRTRLGRDMRACEQDLKMAVAARRRRRPHHLADLRDRRGARRRRRHDVPALLRRGRFLHRLRRRRQGVHRRGARRHRLAARRDARRAR